MTSAVLTLSDNSEAYEQQKYSEPQIQSNATSHSGTAFPNMNYAMPAQLSAENAVSFQLSTLSNTFYWDQAKKCLYSLRFFGNCLKTI
ncbi:uncharacterized protein LOC111386575 isoform X2 [Olea europaea var. sylvestris]|uniref:uncharacterized protein LOC111386575 isoform X2 n=1 Tax=Olea europaea var. sylvestris TaxID=158386 RepID=UPI000C1D6C11|nr:uncharacterized protein LOC111386575 isoform X2 [Olea europaea var. sylvestris]